MFTFCLPALAPSSPPLVGSLLCDIADAGRQEGGLLIRWSWMGLLIRGFAERGGEPTGLQILLDRIKFESRMT